MNGVKELTRENWLLLDPLIASGVFARMFEDGSVGPVSADEWAERFLTVKLSAQVPSDVRNLFEVARGTMVYGCLFYPLFAVGFEQLFRVCEAAVRAKAVTLGIATIDNKGNKRFFKPLLDELRKPAALSDSEYERWQRVREIRNEVSHPETRTLLPPIESLRMLRSIAELIENLFGLRTESSVIATRM